VGYIVSKRIMVISDLHSGAISGLTPPGWQIDKYKVFQGPLWDWYASEVKKVGPVDVLVVNGDAVDGDGSKDTIDHITTDMEDQADIAEKSIRQIKAKKIYMTYGTPFHVAGTMKYENMVAKSLGCEIADTIYLNVNGTRFSFRHATGNAGTPYTQGTQTYKEAVRDLVTAIETEQEPADYIIRSHVHNAFMAGSPERTAITTPCLEVPISVYGWKCRTWKYHVGFLLIEVDDKGRVYCNLKDHIMPLKMVVKREYKQV
jgi:hypothetical protein